MSARRLISAALGEAFNDDIEVIETFRQVGEREPGAGPFIQVFSAGYRPTDYQGVLRARFQVWLCVATRDPNEAEDELEELLPTFITMLESLNWLEWEEATPDVHPDNFFGYVTTITTVTDSIN